MLEVIPKGYRVLVEQLENRMCGEIMLPDNTTMPGVFRFKVVALGEPGILTDGKRVEITVKIGDYVIFDMRSLLPVGPPELHGGRTYGIVPVDAIIGVVTGDIDPPSILRKIVKARPHDPLSAATDKTIRELVH